MPADRIHLVRHGEVDNPRGVIYERLPGYRLSPLGRRMAQSAADALVAERAPVAAIWASPLTRTLESAEPMQDAFHLEVRTDDRLIEAANRFRGRRYGNPVRLLTDPRAWPFLVNPVRPSWGEPLIQVADRMLDAIADIDAATDGGDVVIVSHQLPIWMVHRALAGEKLFHNPSRRRCSLSSITTIRREGDTFVEVAYREPAAALAVAAADKGAT